MDSYCKNLLDILNDNEKCEKAFKAIVDFIRLYGKDIDIDHRKCFERKETTDFLLAKAEDLSSYVNSVLETV